MVIRMIMAALAAGGCVCAAAADDTGLRSDQWELQEIRDTVCLSSEQVLFIPVSNDVPAHEMTYALVPADNLDVISAHVVTEDQRTWLVHHGCESPASRQRIAMNVSTVTAASGGLDF
jgi:hypothetical protein